MMRPALFVALVSALVLPSAAHETREIGLQLWSLRDQMKADVAGALDLVKGWNVTVVETAGTGGLPVEKFKEMLDERGLKPASMHAGYERFAKEFEAVLHEARVLGVTYIMCPYIPHEAGKFDADGARKAAADFNAWGARFREAGFTFGYHPHGFEFAPTGGEGDERVFDVLARETNPDFVTFEMDVFWVYRAGLDPVALLEKYGARWSLLHLKDMRKGALRAPSPGVSPSSAPPTDKVSVGQGEINWPAVLKTAERKGLKLSFVEDETPEPLRCIPESFEYLRALP